MRYLVVFLAGVTVYLLVLLLLRMVFRRRMRLQDRLDRYLHAPDMEPASVKRKKKLVISSVDWTRIILKLPKGRPYVQSVEKRLETGSVSLRTNEFLALEVASLIFGALLFYLALHSIISLLLGAILGAMLPHTLLSITSQRRMAAFKKQIPDTLTLIANGLKAGYSFLQAINIVREEMPSPMRDEFARLVEETTLGIPVDEALQGMAARLHDDDFSLIVTAVTIQRSVGGNLAEVLENIEHTIRERIKIKNEIRVLTAQGKLTGIILVSLPVFIALFMYFRSRNYLLILISDPLGQFMLAVSVILLFFGIIVISKIVDIKV